MTKREYREYLQSPWWRERKRLITEHRGAKCEDCGFDQPDHLELHHLTYERLGREHPEDVILLCQWCHQRRHGFATDQGRGRIPERIGDFMERVPPIPDEPKRHIAAEHAAKEPA